MRPCPWGVLAHCQLRKSKPVWPHEELWFACLPRISNPTNDRWVAKTKHSARQHQSLVAASAHRPWTGGKPRLRSVPRYAFSQLESACRDGSGMCPARTPAGQAAGKMKRSVAEKLPRWGVGYRQSECRALSVELRVPEAFHAGAKGRSRPALSPPGASHSKRARANCLTSHNLQAKPTGVPALWISASPR